MSIAKHIMEGKNERKKNYITNNSFIISYNYI